MTVITQLYCQLHITCQVHVSASTILAIVRLDTITLDNKFQNIFCICDEYVIN